jgi:hypothetical protein
VQGAGGGLVRVVYQPKTILQRLKEEIFALLNDSHECGYSFCGFSIAYVHLYPKLIPVDSAARWRVRLVEAVTHG